jgi:hypothetical protein
MLYRTVRSLGLLVGQLRRSCTYLKRNALVCQHTLTRGCLSRVSLSHRCTDPSDLPSAETHRALLTTRILDASIPLRRVTRRPRHSTLEQIRAPCSFCNSGLLHQSFLFIRVTSCLHLVPLDLPQYGLCRLAYHNDLSTKRVHSLSAYPSTGRDVNRAAMVLGSGLAAFRLKWVWRRVARRPPRNALTIWRNYDVVTK